MNKYLIVIAIFLFPVLLPAQNNLTPRDIIVQSRENTKLKGLESRTRLDINDGKGNVRTRVTTMASRIFDDGTEKRVIVFVSPAEVKGIAMLIFDHETGSDDMWIHLPAIRKTRKIVSSEKSKSFMGSEFSNGDLAIGAIDDFFYKIELEEKIGQDMCWKIKVTPKTDDIADETGIAFKYMWIAKKDYIPRKAFFFDLDEEPWKELSYSGIKMLDTNNKKYFVTHMEIKNLQNNRFSTMDMEEVQFNPEVPAEYFTTSFLERQ